SLLVRRSTLLGKRALELRVNDPLGKPPANPQKAGLRVEVEDSVLDPDGYLVVFRVMKDPELPAADALAWLRQRLRWRDRGSLLRLDRSSLALLRPGRPAGVFGPLGGLAEWDRVWGQKDTGSREGRPRYALGEGARPDSLHGALLPED